MSNGYQILTFPNGDTKQYLPDTSTIYHYRKKKVTEMILEIGLNIYKFETGHIEFIHANGLIEIK